MDGATHTAGAHQLASAQHPQVPAQSWLAEADRVGELEHRDLRDPGQVLQNAEACNAGEGLVMSPELPQRGICEQCGRGHIKNPLWIIAALKTAGVKALPTSLPPRFSFPSPARGEGRKRGRALDLDQQVPGHSWANSQSVW